MSGSKISSRNERGIEIDHGDADLSARRHGEDLVIAIGEDFTGGGRPDKPQGYVRYLEFRLTRDEALALRNWLAADALDHMDFTITPEYWQSVFGAAYKPVRWGKHQAAHPVTVREVITKLQAGEPCPEAVDVIAGLVHSGVCGWQTARHLGEELTTKGTE